VLLLEPRERLPYVLEKVKEAKKRLNLRSKQRVGMLYREVSGSLPGALQEVQAAISQAIRHDVPHIYPSAE
jgi:hypothetical protein